MKKKLNKNLTSFADHLDKQYGKRGTTKREEFEQGFEAFKNWCAYTGNAGKTKSHPRTACNKMWYD